MTAVFRRWMAPAVALLCGAALLVATPGAARAAPTPAPVDEQGDALLRDVLATTGQRYVEARAALRDSKKRQLDRTLALQQAQGRLNELQPQVGKIAAEAYRTGKLTTVAVLLNSRSPDAFLQRAVAINEMNLVNEQKLAELRQAVASVAAAKKVLDLEVAREAEQVESMAKQKRTAERALALVGGDRLTDGFVSATSPIAKPAPRSADGGLPREGCNVDDPTTGGCVTPRTLHMYKEVRRAGFKRFVGCHRGGGPFEHPKGRACDWSLLNRGFAEAHNNDMRLYGNNLCAFLVRNAERLGVLYVIWYRQIWFPATGWKSYSGASAHTDHVHVSML